MKKIITVLAPVAALIAFMVVPTMAQATRAQAPAGTTIPSGSAIQGTSTNLKTQTSSGTISCANGDQAGTSSTNPAETLEGPINSESFSGCTGPLGSTIDIKTNATAAAPWKLQVQQPIADGSYVVHVDPASGSVIQFTAQAQTFIGDVGTCDFSASSIQLAGTAGSNIITLTGTNQLTLQSGPESICGNGTATLEGSYTVTSGGNNVTIDMS